MERSRSERSEMGGFISAVNNPVSAFQLLVLEIVELRGFWFFEILDDLELGEIDLSGPGGGVRRRVGALLGERLAVDGDEGRTAAPSS
jgi:hypothetical protein